MIPAAAASSSVPHGVIAPLPTPLTVAGDLKTHVLVSLLDTLLPHVDGVLVLGSSGEHPWLSDEAADEVMTTVVTAVAGRVPVLQGIGDLGGARTRRRLECAAQSGADYFVATLPAYFPVSDRAAQVSYFTALADSARGPLVLYNIPQNVGQAIRTDALLELAGHPNIVGLKDSGGDAFAFQQYVGASSATFAVLQGREQLLRASILEGAVGTVSSLANLAPSLLAAAVRASSSGDLAESAKLQTTITRLSAVFDNGYWLAALKCSLETLGYAVGPPTFPLPPCTEEQRGRIHDILNRPEFVPWLIRAKERS